MRVGGPALAIPYPAQVGSLSIWDEALAASGVTPTAITCIGDSVTAGDGASDAPHRWTSLLQAQFTADYGSGAVTVNVDGQSGQLSSRFTNPANYTLGTPRLVVLEVGLNDMSSGSSSTSLLKANILDFIADVRSALATDPSFLIIGTYSIGVGYAFPWGAYIDAMRQIGAMDPAVVVLDLRPAFDPPSTAKLAVDLVHPNDTGHALLASTVYAAIT